MECNRVIFNINIRRWVNCFMLGEKLLFDYSLYFLVIIFSNNYRIDNLRVDRKGPS
jgi:hypothetical protein